MSPFACSPPGRLRRAALARLTPGVLLVLLPFLLPACGGPDDLEEPVPLYGEAGVAYPLELWDEGVEGETVLRVRVTETGSVDSVEVARSSGHEGLDSAAVKGVRDLAFQPGRRNGKRARMWATLPVQFSTNPSTHE